MWHDDIGGNIDIGGGLLVLMALERRLNKAKVAIFWWYCDAGLIIVSSSIRDFVER
jgi:hypothetical protein